MQKTFLAIIVGFLLIAYLPFGNTKSQPHPETSTLNYLTELAVPVQEHSLPLIELEPLKYSLPTGFNSSNTYEWGNCTYFVASQLNVPNSLGNANTWAYRASNMGFPVLSEPVIGAVAATTAGYWGHVAIVLDVIDNQVLIKEMNSQGLGVVSTRWVHKYSYKYILFNP